MEVEEGLLSNVIEKLKKDLQMLVRYEVMRGLNKPEANSWKLVPTGLLSFEDFWLSHVCNSIYSAETLPMTVYMSLPLSHQVKFQMIKDTNLFYLPGATYLSQDFINDLIAQKKSLIVSAKLHQNPDMVHDLSELSHLFYDLEVISPYVPSSFNKVYHDKEYLANLVLVLDYEFADRLLQMSRISQEIQKFQIKQLLKFNFQVLWPRVPEVDGLWQSITETLNSLEIIECREATLKEIEANERGGTKLAKEIASRSYNDTLFDEMLEA